MKFLFSFIAMLAISCSNYAASIHISNTTCFDVDVVIYAVQSGCTLDGQTVTINVPANTTFDIPTSGTISWNGTPPSSGWDWGWADVTINASCGTGGTGSNCKYEGTTTVGVCAPYPASDCYDVPTGCSSPCPFPPMPGTAQNVNFNLNITQEIDISIN